jgi:NADH:ubiquinone oxidoreductase subunit D
MSRLVVNGDSYDRYLVRMEEMLQSNRIIKQCIDWLRKNPGPVITDNHKVAPPAREDMKSNMEELDSPLSSSSQKGFTSRQVRLTLLSNIPRVSSVSTLFPMAPTSLTA